MFDHLEPPRLQPFSYKGWDKAELRKVLDVLGEPADRYQCRLCGGLADAMRAVARKRGRLLQPFAVCLICRIQSGWLYELADVLKPDEGIPTPLSADAVLRIFESLPRPLGWKRIRRSGRR
jgi:hypothetical protein